jgi:hypothetical protein
MEFNRDEYVQGNPTERANMYSTLFSIIDPVTGQRAITVDEIRQAERMAAIDATTPTPTTGQVSGAPVPTPPEGPTPQGPQTALTQ